MNNVEENTKIYSTQISINEKEEFVQKIKKWVIIDSQLKIINEKTKKMREMKHELTHQICEYSEKNKIQKKININDGELRITEKKEYSPLTFTYIQECLQKIITDNEHVEFIIKYLKENREITITSDIRRTFSN